MGIWSLIIPIVLLALPFLLTPMRRWIFYVLTSIALLGFYFYAVIYLSAIDSEIAMALGIIIFIPLIVTSICYITEDERRENEEESFYDRRLFFKYGTIVKRDIIPIGTGDEMTEAQMAELVNDLYIKLFEKLDAKFLKDPKYFRKIIKVSDSNKRFDTRYFIKVMFDTLRGSSLTNMINSKKLEIS